MIHISKEEILKLAKTAQISLSEEEIPALVERLEAFISYASYLHEISDQIADIKVPKKCNVTRPDEVLKTPAEPLLELAPKREENYYVVPVILKNNS